jgi:hypothetical protein
MTRYDLGISTVTYSAFFLLRGTTNYLLFGIHCHPRQLFETLYALWSRAIKMAASSNKRMKDLLTDEDISKGLDIEDKSDVFSEESGDFWFDTSEEDSDRVSNTSSIVHESVPYEKV